MQICLLESFPDADSFWDADLLEVLRSTEMEYIDEIIMISPMNLHLATGIPAWRIVSLYREAIAMIQVFHLSMDDDIKDIRKMRRDSGRRE